jgi:cytochrome b561
MPCASLEWQKMLRNTDREWGWPAVALHWLVALLVLATFALGLWMGEVPRTERASYYAIHASLGITLLIVLVVRAVWALINPHPAPPADAPRWQHAAAWLAHLSLYGLTAAAAVAGWLLLGIEHPSIVPQAFGVLPAPAPVTLGPGAEDLLEEGHELIAYALMALVGVHALAALWHHYVLHDDTLRRMCRWRGAAAGSP